MKKKKPVIFSVKDGKVFMVDKSIVQALEFSEKNKDEKKKSLERLND